MEEKLSLKNMGTNNKYDNKFYQLMLEYLGEEIFVSDSKGEILFVNPASSDLIGLPVNEIIGKNVTDLIAMGQYSASSTIEVLAQKKPVHVLQKLKDGRTVVATGVPIFHEGGNDILMVINTSKDVEAVNQLMAKVEKQELELRDKNAVINSLIEERFVNEGFISIDSSMEQIKSTILRLAPLDVTILVQGETGVGKEVVVRALHQFGLNANKPFVKINCGIIPESLIESELFGYEEGAFTGASKTGKKGKVELADGGSIFLDEIGELPLSMQVKLLDFLQDGTFTRVGGTKKIQVNSRIIAATNRDLREMCDKGLFRQDLFYRLNVIPIRIPPLRERRKDIEPLSKYFSSRCSSKYKCHKVFGPEALDMLYRYDWPGNIRELEHIVERAFIMTEEDVISCENIDALLYGEYHPDDAPKIVCANLVPLKEAKEELEKQLILKACEMYKSTYKMAEALGVNQSTVVRLIQKYKKQKR